MPSARKAKALLAWLAVNPDQQHPREKLAAVLWPDSDEVQGRHSLRQALGELRKVIPEDAGPLHATKEWIALDSTQIDVDVHAFNACLNRGDEEALEQAIELYKGEFLEGCNPHSDSFDEWLSTYRADFNVRVSAAIEQRLHQLQKQTDHERVCYFAIRLLNIDPLQEQAYRALMQAHASQGHQAAALRWYRRCQSVLQRELGIEPDAATQALFRELLDGQEPPVARKPAKWVRPAHACACSTSKGGSRQFNAHEQVLYLVGTAIEGILDNIGGQGFLIRGENADEKTGLLKQITGLAKSHGFACCLRDVSDFATAANRVELQELIDGSAACLVKQPALMVVENIHLADMETLKLLASLIAVAGNDGVLLVMTSCFEGEPLDPLWRGAMRGAPLTTIDL